MLEDFTPNLFGYQDRFKISEEIETACFIEVN